MTVKIVPVSKNFVEEAYDRYRKKLGAFISQRVSSAEDAEDILQNVFYTLSKVDTEQNPIMQISSWLYRVARNQITDRYRKKKEERLPESRGCAEDDIVYDVGELMVSAGNGPEAEYFKAMVWTELESALAELPDEQRAVFELTELRGIPFSEISETTGVPVNTLISRKRYAVLHLRQRMKDLYEELLEMP